MCQHGGCADDVSLASPRRSLPTREESERHVIDMSLANAGLSPSTSADLFGMPRDGASPLGNGGSVTGDDLEVVVEAAAEAQAEVQDQKLEAAAAAAVRAAAEAAAAEQRRSASVPATVGGSGGIGAGGSGGDADPSAFLDAKIDLSSAIQVRPAPLTDTPVRGYRTPRM